MFAIGNNELDTKPEAKGKAKCPICKKMHKISYGTTNGIENKTCGFIKHGKRMFLATINNKLL